MVLVIVVVLVIGVPLLLAVRYDRRQKRRGSALNPAAAMTRAAYFHRKNAKSAGRLGAGMQALGENRKPPRRM